MELFVEQGVNSSPRAREWDAEGGFERSLLVDKRVMGVMEDQVF